MTAVFYLDARVLAMPGMNDGWVSDLDAMFARMRIIFPLEVVVLLPPTLTPSVRHRVTLIGHDDLLGMPRMSPVGISGALVIDANVRVARGCRHGWLLTTEAHQERLRASSMAIALMPTGAWRIDPPLVDDIEAPLHEYARKTGAGW